MDAAVGGGGGTGGGGPSAAAAAGRHLHGDGQALAPVDGGGREPAVSGGRVGQRGQLGRGHRHLEPSPGKEGGGGGKEGPPKTCVESGVV